MILFRKWFWKAKLIPACASICLVGSIAVGHPVERIVGTWREPPLQVPNRSVADGPLLGNGRFGAAATWKEPNLEVAFHFGHNSFFAAPTSGVSSCGYEKGGRKALGGLALKLEAHGSVVAYQFPANASVAVHFQTDAGLTIVTAFIHPAENTLLVEVHSTMSTRVMATVWTYSGCHGPPRPPVAREVKTSTRQPRVSQSTSPTTDRLPSEVSAAADGLQARRANGWPFQAEHFPVQWFNMLTRVSSSFTDAAALGNCGLSEGPCVRGFFDVAGGSSTALVMHLLQWGFYDRPQVPPPFPDMQEMWASHISSWRKFWSDSMIEFPGSSITEFHWHMSQYILRASSGGEAAPGLFGPFVVDDQVSWAGDITLNYNAEAVYYGAGAANHLGVFEPYFRTILDYLPAAKRSAKERVPDCSGALHFPGHILPLGVNSGDKGDMGQKQMGLFAAVPFLLFWRFTRDLSFAERSLPFLLGVAAFWQCSLRSGDDLKLHDVNDCAEELCIPDGDLQPDPTVVLSLLPCLFETLSDMTAALNVETENRKRWQAIAQHIAAYPTELVDGQEVIADFFGGEGPAGLALRFHAGGSVAWGGLFAAFPLGTVGLGSGQAEINLVKNSIDRFFHVWPGGKQGNSFPHAFAAAARVGWKPQLLLELWEAYLTNRTDPKCRMYANGMVLGCGGTGLENVGGTAYLNEMLLQSHESVVRLFPAVPSGLAANFRLRAVGGFMISASLQATGQITDVVITAPNSTTEKGSNVAVPTHCSVLCPWRGVDVLVNDEPYSPDALGVIRFSVIAGVTYILKPSMVQDVQSSAEKMDSDAKELRSTTSTSETASGFSDLLLRSPPRPPGACTSAWCSNAARPLSGAAYDI